MAGIKKKGIAGVIILILVIAGIIVLYNSMIITNENEYKLVKKFSKVERIIKTAGLSFKLPFIETTDSLPKEVLFYDMPESDVITMDKKTMVADSYVLWQIKEPLKFTQTLSSSLVMAESRIDTTVYNAMKNVISSHSQTEVISGRDGELSQSIMDKIGNSMDQYGIKLLSVETKHLDLPSNNKTAVFERMISERDEIAATFTAEGQSEAQKIQNQTDKEIAISISNAQKDAAKIIAEGEAEYMRILSEAYSDQGRSEFYTFIRSLEAAKASLSGEDKTLILSADSPIAQIFYKIQ
jgi:membrane protease subunit HflC